MGSLTASPSARNVARAVFNSPYELGLRMVYLLSAIGADGADLQKLVLLDYAVIYSGDLDGPPSLHTPVPFRGNEMLTRRALIEQGLQLMSTRGLVDARLTANGVIFNSGPSSRALTGSVSAPYCRQLEARCEWAAKKFASRDSIALTQIFNDLGHRWGAELADFALDGGRQWE